MTTLLPKFDTAENIRHNVERLFTGDLCSPGLTFLCCDSDGHGVIASPIDDAPANPSDAVCGQAAAVFAEAVSQHAGGVLLVIHRLAPVTVQASDLAWFRAVRAQCAAHRVRCLGVWLATAGSAREIAHDDLGTETAAGLGTA